jgi:hypothetical protein
MGGRTDLRMAQPKSPPKDFERTIKSATALLYAAAAIVLIRRVARYA